MTRAQSGEEAALGELISRLVPRLPNYFDPSGLLGRDDIESIAATAVWEAVTDYDPARGTHFETHAINKMKNRVRNELYRRRPIPTVSLTSAEDADSLLSALTEGAAVHLAQIDPHVLLIKRAFERSLREQSTKAMRALYLLKRREPWLTTKELAHALHCTDSYVNWLLAEMRKMLRTLQANIMEVEHQFELA